MLLARYMPSMALRAEKAQQEPQTPWSRTTPAMFFFLQSIPSFGIEKGDVNNREEAREFIAVGQSGGLVIFVGLKLFNGQVFRDSKVVLEARLALGVTSVKLSLCISTCCSNSLASMSANLVTPILNPDVKFLLLSQILLRFFLSTSPLYAISLADEYLLWYLVLNSVTDIPMLIMFATKEVAVPMMLPNNPLRGDTHSNSITKRRMPLIQILWSTAGDHFLMAEEWKRMETQRIWTSLAFLEESLGAHNSKAQD